MVSMNWGAGEAPSKDPLADLCELVHRRTGALISTERMRDMFATDWSKLSTLAHAVHDRLPRSDAPQELPPPGSNICDPFGGPW